MYVIFPADELLLMTYGAANPRVKPRPTLDCLREPLVPIGERSTIDTVIQTPPTPTPSSSTSSPLLSPAVAVAAITVPANSVSTQQHWLSPITEPPTVTQSLPPSPIARTAALNNYSGKRSSVHSTYSNQLSSVPPTTIDYNINFSNTQSSMHQYYEENMRSIQHEQQQQQQQQQQHGQQHGQQQYHGQQHGQQQQLGQQHHDITILHAGSSHLLTTPGDNQNDTQRHRRSPDFRDHSPSIILETPTTNPTTANFGPGWGRPMSPMDLPPEPTKSPANSSSGGGGSKGRLGLRPKLHLPLGRLGRQQSDQRESHRLREDLQLHVENPIFNSENLRQRNFDAFFESGEPVYKLQPLSPMSAPTDSSHNNATTTTSLAIVGNTTGAGIYDSTTTAMASSSRGNGNDSLFAPTRRDTKTPHGARSKSADHCDSGGANGVSQKDSSEKSSSGQKGRKLFGWRSSQGDAATPQSTMTSSYNGVLKDYSLNTFGEALKSHNNVNFKLIKTA